MTRAFGYLRLSRDRQHSTSIDKQRASVAQLCSSREWELVEVFQDLDVSGTTTKRPGLQAMLGRLDEVDVVVFHRLDRIMRSVIDFAKLVERCRGAGVELVSATEPFDTSSAIGRTLVWLLASVAEIEAENTSKRITATHEHLLRTGRPVGRGRAFGWRHDPETKLFVQVPEEVTAIRAAVLAYLAGGGLRTVARGLADGSLTGMAFTAASGGEMTGEALKRVLSSYRLIGFLTRHGAPATDEPTLEPVLDVGTFELLQAELRRRSQRGLRPRGKHELTGLVVCGACRMRMYAGQSRRLIVYKCRSNVGGHASIGKAFLEEEVRDRLFARVDRIRLQRARSKRRAASAADPHHDLRASLSRLEWGRDELLRDYYQEHRLERPAFEQQLAEIDDRLEGVRSKLAGVADAASIIEARAAKLADLEDLWPVMTTSERRGLFAAFIDRIEVQRSRKPGVRDPDRIRIFGPDGPWE